MEDKIINQILNPENMHQAKIKVISNKGASGIDGISVEEIDEYIKENWARIRQEIIERRYTPQPVLRVEIPKPNGGKRKLGIPTVMDRIIQQAIVQVLTPIIDLDSPQKSRHKKQKIYLNLYTSSFSDGESILLAE